MRDLLLWRKLAGGLPSFLMLFFSAASAGWAQTNGNLQWRELQNPYGGAAGLVACVETAKKERPNAWSCMGGELTTDDVGPDGNVQVTTRVIAEDFQDTTAHDISVQADDDISVQADDYDSWCENGSVCGRRISDYIAEVKGNGAYGDAHGVIGRLDFIVRQEFNGPYPRWRGLLIWDSGPPIVTNEFFNVCRINRAGPDGVCGTNQMFFLGVSSSKWRDWWPSSTGLDQLNSRLGGATRYHDDNFGSFHAVGYGQTFYVPSIHTGRWDRCGRIPYCRYYQVPWRP